MITISDKKVVGKFELFTVDIDGTKIFDCKLMDSAKGQFISGPSRSYVAKDGTTKWVNLASFGADHQREIKDVLQGAELPVIDVDAEDIPF